MSCNKIPQGVTELWSGKSLFPFSVSCAEDVQDKKWERPNTNESSWGFFKDKSILNIGICTNLCLKNLGFCENLKFKHNCS